MQLLQLERIKEISGGIFPFDIFFPDAFQPSPVQTVNKNASPVPYELGAIAYTASNNCYLGTPSDTQLLAHECAHLAQQW